MEMEYHNYNFKSFIVDDLNQLLIDRGLNYKKFKSKADKYNALGFTPRQCPFRPGYVIEFVLNGWMWEFKSDEAFENILKDYCYPTIYQEYKKYFVYLRSKCFGTLITNLRIRQYNLYQLLLQDSLDNYASLIPSEMKKIREQLNIQYNPFYNLT